MSETCLWEILALYNELLWAGTTQSPCDSICPRLLSCGTGIDVYIDTLRACLRLCLAALSQPVLLSKWCSQIWQEGTSFVQRR